MSLAAVEQSSPPTATVGLSEVESALARRHDVDNKRRSALQHAYVQAVNLAAFGEPIPDDVADAAVEAAHQFGFHPARMDTDVAIVRRVNEMERQESEWRSTAEARNKRTAEIKIEIEAARRLVAELQSEGHRLGAAGYFVVANAQERREFEANAPHLFKRASELTDAEWRHVRAGS
jgi:hypothetical protein